MGSISKRSLPLNRWCSRNDGLLVNAVADRLSETRNTMLNPYDRTDAILELVTLVVAAIMVVPTVVWLITLL